MYFLVGTLASRVADALRADSISTTHTDNFIAVGELVFVETRVRAEVVRDAVVRTILARLPNFVRILSIRVEVATEKRMGLV